jgi:hypothetical protein
VTSGSVFPVKFVTTLWVMVFPARSRTPVTSMSYGTCCIGDPVVRSTVLPSAPRTAELTGTSSPGAAAVERTGARSMIV